jgi:two-component system LytT family response regulator
MLQTHPGVEVVGEADGVRRAVQVIGQTWPDVVFLDVQMPEASGFELLEKVSSPFKVVFVTAFDEYAIRAFDVNALDYLLKPVNPERLARAVERLSASPREAPKVAKALEYDDHLFLSVGDHSRFIKVGSIKCIYAAGVYTEVHTADGRRALVHKSLNEWEERLPEKYFPRIHRGAIINVEYVERAERMFNYSYQVYLRGIAEPVVMSRRYAANLKGRLS